MEENIQAKDAQQALIDLALDSAKVNKQHTKRWFNAFVISNAVWAFVVLCIVVSFVWLWNQYDYAEESTETTVYQETGEGTGNNVYQAGEHATYNEGGELNGEAGDQNQNNEKDEN